MNKSLIVHNDNVLHLDGFTSKIKFTPSYSDIDEYITADIIPELENIKFDIVYIKDSLSSNYLELYGLRLAHHIRLSQELKEKRFIPIVILSDVSSYILNKLTPLAKILFTKNLFIIKNTTQSIQAFNTENLKNLDQDDYQNKFLNLIEIEAPKESHHDIANEWSIFKWSNFLNIKENQKIDANKNKIDFMLYFKYLVAKYPIPINTKFKLAPKPPVSNGNILYIDDEWDNGWEDIFKKYFSKTKNITFRTLNTLDQDTNYTNLLKAMNENIVSFKPDLIILDMRLINSDHNSDIDQKDVSGIKLLKHIKEEINPGIQVIMLTASGKSIILEEAHKYDILGYLKKEHPADTTINTKDDFVKLKSLIDQGLEKKYLIRIWSSQNNISSLDIFKEKKYNQIKIEINAVFEILNSDMKNKFAYAMFAIFKVLEIIISFYIEEKRENKKRFAYWKNTNNKIPRVDDMNIIKQTTHNDKNDSTENKIRVIMHEKLNIRDKFLHDQISEITMTRNRTIHPNRDKFSLDENNILNWFVMLYKILCKVK